MASEQRALKKINKTHGRARSARPGLRVVRRIFEAEQALALNVARVLHPEHLRHHGPRGADVASNPGARASTQRTHHDEIKRVESRLRLVAVEPHCAHASVRLAALPLKERAPDDR